MTSALNSFAASKLSMNAATSSSCSDPHTIPNCIARLDTIPNLSDEVYFKATMVLKDDAGARAIFMSMPEDRMKYWEPKKKINKNIEINFNKQPFRSSRCPSAFPLSLNPKPLPPATCHRRLPSFSSSPAVNYTVPSVLNVLLSPSTLLPATFLLQQKLLKMRELVTIQVGTFANYVGSHFWNFQDELLGLAEEPNGDSIIKNSCLDMDVLYRTGETQQGIPTYSPRLLSVGFQGSLGCLNLSGSLYDNTSPFDSKDVLTWTGNVSRCVAEPHKKNLFLQSLSEQEHERLDVSKDDSYNQMNGSQRLIQDKDQVECLENDVKFWTDFCKVQYHHRSLYELNSSWTDIQKFDNYGIGKDVLAGSLQLEEMNERLRYFVEECDHIQGFQFLVDDSGGFSSVAAEILESAADEYTNTPVMLYSVRDPDAYAYAGTQKSSVARALHDAVSFSRLSSFSKLMVPVGLPSLRSALSPLLCVDDQKPFHTSAVYAASIHSITIPFRMQMLGPATDSADTTGAMDVGEIVHTFSSQSWQNMVTILDVAMPPSSLTDEVKQGNVLRNLRPLTPEVKEYDEDLLAVESLVVNGALHSGNHRATMSQVKDSVFKAYQSGTSKPLFSHLSVAPCPLPIPLPFPSIFASSIGQHGELISNPAQGAQSRGSLEIESIPMAARLRSSTAIMPFMERRLGSLRRYGITRGAPGAELLSSWGFGKEEVDEMGEHLSKLLTTFDTHSQTSDSD
ncbi:hypothetical protein Cni_G17836 [Canna indica]|uniref:Uncharacterized protein n=1 Tax=Canna indica TaxID=4628 RepID=A0AAQ3KL65_9LILI|nr:hypothetical protein Cni_G17836 [Canna indica]